MIRIVLFEYDDLGRKALSYSPLFQGSHNRSEYKYDDEGNLVEEKWLDELDPLYTKRYKYSENQTISILRWDNQDWGGIKCIKTFDKDGKIIENTTFQDDKKWIDTYRYNLEVQLLQFTSYDSDGKVDLTHIYRYNK